ncbi:MAG: hypothetical protein DRN66_00910 [Candidatus Nanohalarchaeota archaeon]|nr:MAG: hypothetical protein DRN66_00910 [Candidatus Nanohaloarchaeota archaeon]
MKKVGKTEIWLVILLLIGIMIVVAIAIYMNVVKASTEDVSDNASEQINTSLPSQKCIMECIDLYDSGGVTGSCESMGLNCEEVLLDEDYA